MDTTKRTPGPWHVGQRQAHRIVYDSKGWAVCDCTVYHGQEDAEEMKANAALIAAAPELLEAVKSILKLDQRKPFLMNDERALLLRAEAKAEGRS